MRREGFSLRHLADRERRRLRAEVQVIDATNDTISISRQLLGEAAMLAPVVGLPPRAAPLRSRLMPVYDPAYWTFSMRTNETLRIGPLTVQIRPGAASRARLDLAWPALLPLRVVTRLTSPIPPFCSGDNPPGVEEVNKWTPVQERVEWRDKAPCEVPISLPKPGHWPPTLTISRSSRAWDLIRINLHDPTAQIPPVLSFQAT